ncbi:hypothetical protein NCAS_0A06690 [Naumovozyma castellii]|uniref:Phenazine biosynthesis protein n=1 Tax=Naumovozyma castellii TaxID=27288 RepID=G0V6X9_NAUCA|nr:hypothetical protein NCAS_0A06690 [Naumovozyma castellii CBS 4309]CCC67227.1 hypothetical protein NCAS_0A06690 [Naumovozyma castellii CBS 4309]
MTLNLPFKQIDVFTATPFKGNPVAVVNCMDVEESDVTTEQLQSVANWTNLSETTFLFKPTLKECDYKLRIFTPANELPFAGHPTVGSCRAYLQFKNIKNATAIKQECGVGIVDLSVEGDKISFVAARADVEEVSDSLVESYKTAIGVPYVNRPSLMQTGPAWFVYLVDDADTCLNLNLNLANLKQVCDAAQHSGVILAGPRKSAEGIEYEMRALFTVPDTSFEDPVCGSGAVALLRYLQTIHNYDETVNVHITQGRRVHRNGHINGCIKVDPSNGAVSYHVGGSSVAVINGEITL